MTHNCLVSIISKNKQQKIVHPVLTTNLIILASSMFIMEVGNQADIHTDSHAWLSYVLLTIDHIQ